MMNEPTNVSISTTLATLTPHLNQLAEHIYANNKAKGFWDEERNVGELLMLVVSELGEALEAHRSHLFSKVTNEEKATMETDFPLNVFRDKVKNTFEDEIADTIIRLLDLSAGLGIDIGWHVQKKVAYNTSRPHKHGKKY